MTPKTGNQEKELRATRRTMIKQSLQVVLTNDEKLDMGQQLAQAEQVRSEAESKMATFRAQMKATIEEATAKIDGFVSRISSGYEYRDVPCEKVEDYEAGRITIFRCDTGEIVHTRAMTSDEQQIALQV